MWKKVLLIILIIACLGAGMFFMFKFFSVEAEHKRGRDIYDEISDNAVFPSNVAEIVDAAQKGHSGLKIDFERLQEINSDVQGWLYIPETSISYPVVQTIDNDHYLRYSFNGERNGSGTLFLDKDYDGESQNTVIYGHHMKDGSMLAGIDKYKEQWYFDKHNTGFYITPECEYRIDFISCRLTKGTNDAFLSSFGEDEIYERYLAKLDSNALTFREEDMSLTAEDRIITIVTCDYSQNDGRLVLIGKKTELR